MSEIMDPTPSSGICGHCIHVVHRHISNQITHAHKINKFEEGGGVAQSPKYLSGKCKTTKSGFPAHHKKPGTAVYACDASLIPRALTSQFSSISKLQIKKIKCRVIQDGTLCNLVFTHTCTHMDIYTNT